MINEAWYDMRGNYCTGFDAHVKAWRYWTGVKYQQEQEVWNSIAKKA